MNKTFAIALATATIAGSAALADSYILFTAETQEEGSTVQFDTIQADALALSRSTTTTAAPSARCSA